MGYEQVMHELEIISSLCVCVLSDIILFYFEVS